MIKLADRLAFVKPSPTLAADAKAKAMIAAGEDVVNLGVGEPDFDSPAVARDAGIAAIRAGKTKYGPVSGTPGLRKRIVEAFQREQGLTYSPEQILVSVGAKHSLANLFQATLNEGDEVVLPGPFWVSYPDMIALAGGKAVIVETESAKDFVPDPRAIEGAITSRTRMICFNSPTNPTGAGYPRALIEEIVRIAEKHNLMICSDEIYRKLSYDGFEPVSPAEISPQGYARTIIINGVSKTFAMTGWRIGYAAGPLEIIKGMTTIQSQSTSGPSFITQDAAEAALGGSETVVQEMVSEFAKRMDYVVKRLRDIPGVKCSRPKGAFYVFPDVRAYLGKTSPAGIKVQTSIDMQNYLLEESKIAVVAGAPFGAEGFLRISFAVSMPQLEKALDRLAKGLTSLRG